MRLILPKNKENIAPRSGATGKIFSTVIRQNQPWFFELRRKWQTTSLNPLSVAPLRTAGFASYSAIFDSQQNINIYRNEV